MKGLSSSNISSNLVTTEKLFGLRLARTGNCYTLARATNIWQMLVTERKILPRNPTIRRIRPLQKFSSPVREDNGCVVSQTVPLKISKNGRSTMASAYSSRTPILPNPSHYYLTVLLCPVCRNRGSISNYRFILFFCGLRRFLCRVMNGMKKKIQNAKMKSRLEQVRRKKYPARLTVSSSSSSSSFFETPCRRRPSIRWSIRKKEQKKPPKFARSEPPRENALSCPPPPRLSQVSIMCA